MNQEDLSELSHWISKTEELLNAPELDFNGIYDVLLQVRTSSEDIQQTEAMVFSRLAMEIVNQLKRVESRSLQRKGRDALWDLMTTTRWFLEHANRVSSGEEFDLMTVRVASVLKSLGISPEEPWEVILRTGKPRSKAL